jgi:hypothetical protein
VSGQLAGDAAILARWPGLCPYCARPIERGNVIVKVAREWLHDRCPSDDGLLPADEVDAGPDLDEEDYRR